MTDLRTLLHESAPLPSRPLDMRDVRRRAERAGTRRVLAWLGGLGVVVGLGIPVGDAILVPADRGDVVGVGGGASTTSSSPVTTTAIDATVAVDDRRAPTSSTIRLSGEASAGRSLDDDAVSAKQLEGGSSPPVSTSPGATAPIDGVSDAKLQATDGYPLASACSVDNAGLGPRGQRTCRFTATVEGGAELRSDGVATAAGNGAEGRVTITRDGRRTTTTVQYNSANAGDFGVFGCGGLLEPGDLVEVVLTNGAAAPDGSTMTLGAGEGWYCWQ